MKIGFFANSDFNIATYRMGLIRRARVMGFEVFAICPITDQKFISEIESRGVDVIPVRIARGVGSPFNNFRYIWQVIKICQQYQFDICHNFTPKCNTLAVIAQKMAGMKKIICSITGLGYIYTSQGFKAKILKLISNTLYFLSFSFADKVIFQNEDDQDYFIKKNFLDHKKAELILSSGVDLDLFSPDEINEENFKRISQEIGKKEGDIVFAYIGRLLWPKGISEFIEAGKILKKKYNNIKIVLVGVIDKENPEAIKKQDIEKWQKQGDAVYLGERRDVKDILAVIDVFVYPSYYREGVPKALLEAGAMAKPLIAADNIGSKEVIENGINGFLVKSKNVNELADKMEELLNNKILRDKFGEVAKEKIIKEFDGKIINGKIVSLYWT